MLGEYRMLDWEREVCNDTKKGPQGCFSGSLPSIQTSPRRGRFLPAMSPQPATVRPGQGRQVVGARDLVPRVEEVADRLFATLARAHGRALLGRRGDGAIVDAVGHLCLCLCFCLCLYLDHDVDVAAANRLQARR